MSDSPFSLKGEQSMAKSTMTITLKNSLKLENGKIIPGGKIFRGELNELPEWLQLELKMNSRVLEVERLRIPDVKKASVTELKKDSLMSETQKEAPVEIVKDPIEIKKDPVETEKDPVITNTEEKPEKKVPKKLPKKVGKKKLLKKDKK
jgi:hypothetical protein